jgi:hypothetical protein
LSLTRPNTSPPKRLNRKPMPHSISHSDACLPYSTKSGASPMAVSEEQWIPLIPLHGATGTVEA